MTANRPLILPMLVSDLDAVCAIAESSFPAPWSRSIMEKELGRKWSVARVIRSGTGEKPCGFITYWLVADEIHLHNIAIRPEMRRRGYARALVRDMLETARTSSTNSIWLEVRRSNQAAFELYRSLGFVKAGVRPRYYADNDEDALLMVLRLQAASKEAS